LWQLAAVADLPFAFVTAQVTRELEYSREESELHLAKVTEYVS